MPFLLTAYRSLLAVVPAVPGILYSVFCLLPSWGEREQREEVRVAPLSSDFVLTGVRAKAALVDALDTCSGCGILVAAEAA